MIRQIRILSTAAIALIAASCINEPDEDVFSLGPGDPLPRFEVVTNDGSIVSDRSLAGRDAVIVFFNTSCPDCREHLPEIDRHWRQSIAAGSSTNYICIAREESAATIEKFWTENNMSIPWSEQRDNTVYRMFASAGIPRVYIISPTGHITRVYQ